MDEKLNPNSELVATTFVRELLSPVPANFGVGTTLPENTASWSDGFIQLQVVGGSPDIDVPTRRPLIQVDCWVPSINSSKPQWGRAATIGENLTNFIYEFGEGIGKQLSLGTFKDALVQSVYLASEPRRITNDPAGHARFSFDISLTWIVSETPVPVGA